MFPFLPDAVEHRRRGRLGLAVQLVLFIDVNDSAWLKPSEFFFSCIARIDVAEITTSEDGVFEDILMEPKTRGNMIFKFSDTHQSLNRHPTNRTTIVSHIT